MMNQKIIIFLSCIFLLFTLNLFADDHSKSEVKNLIKTVKTEFSKIQTSGKTEGSEKEIKQIQNHIKLAEELFDDDEYDSAYFEINIANAYFKIIEAKNRLIKIEKKYKKIKEKTGR